MTDKKKGFQPPASEARPGSPPRRPPLRPTPAAPASGHRLQPPGHAAAARAPPQASPEPQSFSRSTASCCSSALWSVGLVRSRGVGQSATAAPYTCTTLLTPGPMDRHPDARAPAPSARRAAASAAPGRLRRAGPARRPRADARAAAHPAAGLRGPGPGPATSATAPASRTPTARPPAATLQRAQHGAPAAPVLRRQHDARPGNWVHNLEHGYVVLLYKGEPRPPSWRSSRRSWTRRRARVHHASRAVPNKVIAVRFDDMDTSAFAAVPGTGRCFAAVRPATLRTYAEQWQEVPVTRTSARRHAQTPAPRAGQAAGSVSTWARRSSMRRASGRSGRMSWASRG